MKTFVLNITYMATGEGLSQFILVEKADTKEDFLKFAHNHIDAYFLSPFKNPDFESDPTFFLLSSDEIPDEYLERIRLSAPTVANIINKKKNEIGSFSYFSHFHLNLS